MCPFTHPVVAQSLKPVKLLSQRLPTFLLFRDHRSVAQQCWIRLHSSSSIVGATHAHYTWSPRSLGSLMGCIHSRPQNPSLLGHVVGKRSRLQIKPSGSGDENGLYPSHDALQVPTLLVVVASVSPQLSTLTQQLPRPLRVVASVCT